MIINIEDYNGNDVLKLNFKGFHSKGMNVETVNDIDEIAEFHGYSFADFDDGEFRVKQMALNTNENDNRKILSNLVRDLVYKFI